MSFAPKPYLQEVSIRPDAEINFGVYPYNIPAVSEIGVLEFHPDVTFFVGENESGKSTVLEGIALALGFSTEGGTRTSRLKQPNPYHQRKYCALLEVSENQKMATFFEPSDVTFVRLSGAREANLHQ